MPKMHLIFNRLDDKYGRWVWLYLTILMTSLTIGFMVCDAYMYYFSIVGYSL